MTNVKKQHYVPQLYLRRFASPDERLYAFNKFTRKSYLTRVADSASEMRFYDFHPDFYQNLRTNIANGTAEQLAKALDQQLVEHELGVKEARFAPVFSDILTSIE